MNNRDRQLADLLTDLRAQDRSARPSLVVEEVVMARWDARVASRRVADGLVDTRVDIPRRPRVLLRVAAAAAGTIAASVALLLLVDRPAPLPGARQASPVTQPVVSEVPTAAVEPQRSEPVGQPQSVSTRRLRTRPTVRNNLVEQRVAFEGLAPLDTGSLGAVRMMRVRLTPGAASSLGLSHASLAGDGYVQADVLVGEDGLARAIRLVHQP